MIQCALRTKNKHISAYSALGTDALFLYHDICGVALGHCKSGTTLNVYSHMFQNAQARVSEAMDKAFAFLPQEDNTDSE